MTAEQHNFAQTPSLTFNTFRFLDLDSKLTCNIIDINRSTLSCIVRILNPYLLLCHIAFPVHVLLSSKKMTSCITSPVLYRVFVLVQPLLSNLYSNVHVL